TQRQLLLRTVMFTPRGTRRWMTRPQSILAIRAAPISSRAIMSRHVTRSPFTASQPIAGRPGPIPRRCSERAVGPVLAIRSRSQRRTQTRTAARELTAAIARRLLPRRRLGRARTWCGGTVSSSCRQRFTSRTSSQAAGISETYLEELLTKGHPKVALLTLRGNPLPFASRLPRATGRDHQAPARGRRGRFVMGLFIWIADAHRGDGKRFVVRAEEKLTAFLELESAIRPIS